MGINTLINNFNNDLVKVINESGLPPSIVKMSLVQLLMKVEEAERNAIEQEKEMNDNGYQD